MKINIVFLFCHSNASIMGQAFQPYIGRMNLNAQSAIKVLLFFCCCCLWGGGGGGGGAAI